MTVSPVVRQAGRGGGMEGENADGTLGEGATGIAARPFPAPMEICHIKQNG
jgi:hypothetical protein